MLDVEFKIKNYRCFGDSPTSFRVRDGFTALVGTNNSGKSSLLRLLYEIRPLLNELGGSEGTTMRRVLRGQDRTSWAPRITPGERFSRAGTDRPLEIQIIVRDGPGGKFAHNDTQLMVETVYDPTSGVGNSPTIKTLTGQTPEYDPPSMSDDFFHPLATAMRALGDTMYIGPFRNAIHVGANEGYYDIQTGNAFVGVFSEHKSGNFPAHNEAMFEMLQEIRRIFGFQSLDINPSGNTLQVTIDGRSFRLGEQGAGFAHFIVVMVNVLVRRPQLLLIDEPELNLHASLQLDFLQSLVKYTKFGVIFATHSLGLARTASDQIYTLTKSPAGTSELRPYEDNHDLVMLLGQLSFDNRPQMGFSKVLLVEGKTEIRALMQFLRLYDKEHEVLMLPLHGADLIRPDSGPELSELLRIGDNVKYVIDSEREAAGAALEPSRQGFVDLCARLNIPGIVLERRALENYFTDEAVKRAIGSATHSLGPFDKLAKKPGSSWRKTDNWRVASEMRKEDLEGTDLGSFLEAL